MASNVQIAGEGKRIVLDFPSLGEALQLWKPWPAGKGRAEVTQRLHRALSGAGLSLEVRVQGKVVASLGGNEISGIALQLLERHSSLGESPA